MCAPCLQGAEIIAFAKLVGRGGGEEGELALPRRVAEVSGPLPEQE